MASSTGSPPERDELLQVGFVAKSHGLDGEVIVGLTTDRTERVAPGSILYGESEAFDRVIELVVYRSRPHQGRWIVNFEGWASRDAAEMLRGTTLLAEPIEDPGAMWMHEMIGCVVVDQEGVRRGKVTCIEANPASDLLVLESGGLVPLAFVTRRERDEIHVDIPEGLLPDGSQ